MELKRIMSVIVYILTDDANGKNANYLKRKFNSHLFHVKAVSISYDKDNKSKAEMYRFRWCLKDAKKNYPGDYVLIVKDTSITHSSSNDIENVVSKAMENPGWDLCYLCRWLDRCDLYDKGIHIEDHGTALVKTKSPNGTQCILFSKSGRDIILGGRKMRDKSYFKCDHSLGNKLNSEISKDNIKAICAHPNLFTYNVLSGENTGDLAKMSECRAPEVHDDHLGIPIYWFALLVIILIIVLAAFMAQRKYK